MSTPHKIATCCYCGTRAALVLKGKQQHELSCANCGAPLHNLKMVPKVKLAERPTQGYKPARKYKKYKKKKKRGLFSRVLDEAWDVIEDVFD
ncbi:hypothetical protein [Ruegeria halocynthiae]|uniref:hypothetical protein n=1 Tax=Ruegeria halocynthiae TaxID=985054 RepID=UPI000943FE6E|nr:hypothetical protein [Ruegeria halocynthiae]